MQEINIRIKLVEEVLGTSSANKEIHRDYIVGKFERAALEGKAGQVLLSGRPMEVRPEDAVELGREELEALKSESDADAKSMTVFPRMTVGDNDDVPFIWDYQIKGFFKDSMKALRRVSGTESSKVKAYKQVIDKLIFPTTRKMPWMTEEGPVSVSGTCERPLRASTPQGDRVALSCSETVPEGSFIDVPLVVFDMAYWPALRECLTYGAFNGLGQWRNSGKGRFVWKITDPEPPTAKDKKHMEYNPALE